MEGGEGESRRTLPAPSPGSGSAGQSLKSQKSKNGRWDFPVTKQEVIGLSRGRRDGAACPDL